MKTAFLAGPFFRARVNREDPVSICRFLPAIQADELFDVSLYLEDFLKIGQVVKEILQEHGRT